MPPQPVIAVPYYGVRYPVGSPNTGQKEWWRLPRGHPVRLAWERWARLPPWMRPVGGPRIPPAAYQPVQPAPAPTVPRPPMVGPSVRSLKTGRPQPGPQVIPPTAPPSVSGRAYKVDLPPKRVTDLATFAQEALSHYPFEFRHNVDSFKRLPERTQLLTLDWTSSKVAPEVMRSGPVAEEIRRGYPERAFRAALRAWREAGFHRGPGRIRLSMSYREKERRRREAARWLGPTGSEFAPRVVDIQASKLLAAGYAASRAAEVRRKAKPLLEVIDEIPWPHSFMRSFWELREVGKHPHFRAWPGHEQTLFFKGIPIWNLQALEEAGYMSRSKNQIRHDVARWLVENEQNIERHFVQRVNEWIREKERKARKEAKLLKMFGFVMKVFSALGPVGVGAVISPAFTIYKAERLSKTQIKLVRDAQRILNISEDRLQKFRDWVARWATYQPKGFVVKVEGKIVGEADTAEEAAKLAVRKARKGSRFEIFRDGESTGLYIWTGVSAQRVPEEMVSKVRQMSPDELENLVKRAEQKVERPSKFPWWILLAVPGIYAAVAS